MHLLIFKKLACFIDQCNKLVWLCSVQTGNLSLLQEACEPKSDLHHVQAEQIHRTDEN